MAQVAERTMVTVECNNHKWDKYKEPYESYELTEGIIGGEGAAFWGVVNRELINGGGGGGGGGGGA